MTDLSTLTDTEINDRISALMPKCETCGNSGIRSVWGDECDDCRKPGENYAQSLPDYTSLDAYQASELAAMKAEMAEEFAEAEMADERASEPSPQAPLPTALGEGSGAGHSVFAASSPENEAERDSLRTAQVCKHIYVADGWVVTSWENAPEISMASSWMCSHYRCRKCLTRVVAPPELGGKP